MDHANFAELFEAAPARRGLLLAGLGLAFAAPAVAAPKPGTSFRDAMPTLWLNQGVWEGVYRKIDGACRPLDEYDFRIEVRLANTSAAAYRQHNLYRWADGKTREADLIGDYADGAMTWSNDTSNGAVREVAQGVLWMGMHFVKDPGLEILEISFTAPDGSARSRVSLQSRNGQTQALFVAQEHRAA